MIWTLTGVAVPTKSLFGVNEIVLFALSNSYLPWGVVTLVTSSPASFNNVRVSGSNSTRSPFGPVWVPLSKLTVLPLSSPVSSVSNLIGDVCTFPCTSLVSDFSAVGTTGVILGVYVVVTAVPFVSLPWIVTGLTSPEYSLFVGVNTAVGFPSTTLSV